MPYALSLLLAFCALLLAPQAHAWEDGEPWRAGMSLRMDFGGNSRPTPPMLSFGVVQQAVVLQQEDPTTTQFSMLEVPLLRRGFAELTPVSAVVDLLRWFGRAPAGTPEVTLVDEGADALAEALDLPILSSD